MTCLQIAHWGVAAIGAIFTGMAAVFWFLAARVKTPQAFDITVQVFEHEGFGGGGGGGGLGAGYSVELFELAQALSRQSVLNSRAARCACAAAVVGIVLLAFPQG